MHKFTLLLKKEKQVDHCFCDFVGNPCHSITP